jgi:putative heme-binding domain-containing protein
MTLSELSLAIKEDFAADFVVSQLATLANSQPQRIAEYLTYAARYAPPARLAEIATQAQSSFAHDSPFQEGLAYSLRDGLRQRGMDLSPDLQQWAKVLACTRWNIDPRNEKARLQLNEAAMSWTYLPLPAGGLQDNPWGIVGVPSASQSNNPNVRQTHPTFTSIVKGEERTGIYRSTKFLLPEVMSFFLAGHDGYPDKPLREKNWVRIHDGQTGQVLRQWQPPRNDVAQEIRWVCGEFSGREVYLELVDGNTDQAYAWLAVSRFSVSGLNPSSMVEDWRRGATLVKDFRIRSLWPVLVDLLQHPTLDRSVAVEAAKGLIENPSGMREAVAESLGFEGVAGDLREQVIQEVTADGKPLPPELLMQIFRVSSRDQQRQLAVHLSTDALGAKWLLEGIEKGYAARNLLQETTVAAKLSTLSDPSLVSRCNRLMEDLPQLDPQREQFVARKKKVLQETEFRTVSVEAGGKLFQSACAGCHQVRNQGNQVGPNLDGIGNRGLLRLVEDVLLPHQNVDLAFATTVVVMDDGTVRSGFARREEGAQLLMVDSQGKEFSLPIESIEHRKKTNYSPMPENFAELLSDEQCQELYAYLLSLR